MNRLATAIALLLLSPLLHAQTDFDQWLQEQEEAFSAYSEELDQQYREYANSQIEAFREFVAQVEEVWGQGNVWVPTQVEWVRYADDLARRTKVDFRSGSADLQWLFPANQTPQERAQAIREALVALLLTGTTDPVERLRQNRFPDASPPSYTIQQGDSLWKISRKFDITVRELAEANQINPSQTIYPGQILLLPASASDEVRDTASTSGQPLLHHQVSANGKRLTRANANSIAQALLEAYQPASTTAHDGRTEVSFSFPLAPNHLKVRRERALPHARKFAAEYAVPLTLVLSIMEVESAFNPRARSYIPAFGLMQLVPASGARDAYRFVFKKDRLVGARYLYHPARNARLGTAYLHLLLKRYFGKVEDPLARIWCAVAAYNTGPGNVARALTGSTSLSAVPATLRGRSAEQVYRDLRTQLPYEETRNYVAKVHDTLQSYHNAAN